MENELRPIETPKEKITRKEALIKAGKYAAITALGTMILLSPKKSQADSPGKPGHGGFG
jgi:hypothetical protein